MRTSSARSGSQASLLPGANYETAAPAEINGAVVLSWSKSIPRSSRAGAEHPLQPPSQLVLGTASCSPQPSALLLGEKRLCRSAAKQGLGEKPDGGGNPPASPPGGQEEWDLMGFSVLDPSRLLLSDRGKRLRLHPLALPVISERERGEMLRRREKPAGHRRAGLTIRSVYF